jgi:hypothetical protein
MAQSTNSSAVINWENPGGTVNFYVVQYVLALDQMGFASDNVVTILVNPDETSVTVGDENLLPGATYRFRVAVNNSRGLSAFSPQGTFQILGKERQHNYCIPSHFSVAKAVVHVMDKMSVQCTNICL